MMYTDHYLRFPDQATAQAALYDGELPRHVNTDIVGLLLVDREAEVPVWREGWHVNIALAEGESLHPAIAPYEIPAPQNPARVRA